jgi:dihydrofolate reductase/thymidylate synthase
VSGAARTFSIVVAMDRNRGIGNKGDLPWPKLKGDMKFFRELTTCPDRAAVEARWGMKLEASSDIRKWGVLSEELKGTAALPTASEGYDNTVIMGRITWQSLPLDYQPLRMRANLVLSRNPEYRTFKGRAHGWSSMRLALQGARETQPSVETFVIGGGEAYESALKESDCLHLYITEIDAAFECDTFFPETPDFAPALFSPWIEENGIRYRFTRWDRKA